MKRLIPTACVLLICACSYALAQFGPSSGGIFGGIVGVANGGTGLTTGNSGGVVCFTASATMASSNALAANGVVIGGGAGACPTNITAGTAGQLLVGTAAAPNFVTPASTTVTSASPSAITPGTSAYVMLGLGSTATITPAATGRIFMTISGTLLIGSTTNGALTRCTYGTGAAPGNGVAETGSTVGIAQAYLAGAATEKAPFVCQGVVTGLALATAVWLDVSAENTTGSQALTYSQVTVSAFEF